MIRPYEDSDYEKLKELYMHGKWFGGVFDEARDGRQKLVHKIAQDPESIWVYEHEGQLLGSISIVDDGRVAWLFRYVAKGNDQKMSKELYDKVIPILKKRGHTQVIAYSPVDDEILAKRYRDLGMVKGNSYTAYWTDI